MKAKSMVHLNIYSRLIFLFFAIALLMPMLCHSDLADEIFDEENTEISYGKFKMANVDPSVAYTQIIYHANGQLCWKDPKVYTIEVYN